jgi:NNP family nitrate/nitrite transporter-like MFS transporter
MDAHTDNSPLLAPAASRATDVAARVRAVWNLQGRHKVLHATWFAFFLSFVVWFNYAPFANTIAEQLGFTKQQKITLGLVNVALTVPARILIGMALDRWGPRRVYSAILLYAAVPCLVFATATSFEVMVGARLALSVVGAGFVVGIRMISEWFPPREVGTAEGVYGGWGNFGSAAAAFSLPLVAAWIGGDDGWRWAVATTGLISAAYGLAYLRLVADTPDGVTYARPKRQGALEVTSPGAVWGLAALTVPLTAILGLIAWRVYDVDVLSEAALALVLGALVVYLGVQLVQVFRVNRPALADDYETGDRYPLRSVAVLAFAYLCCFGSELAVVTMLPTFFADTWALGPAAAGIAASAFAFMNLVARPSGGLLSDLLGSRKRTLAVLMAGMVGGYVLMGSLGAAWPWLLAVGACMVCSFFVQSSEGAVYAIVPLVKKRVSGQIAGIVGAYGNIGALLFITASLYVSPTIFFLIIAASSIAGLAACRFLVEPANAFADELLTDEATPPVVVDLDAAHPAGTPGLAPAATT